MDKLIITATCDSTVTFPAAPYTPTRQGIKAVADEYIRCANAGAVISHLHGPFIPKSDIGSDKSLDVDLDIAGWLELTQTIKEGCNTLIQYGFANAPVAQRQKLMEQSPDMMSVCFNAHDECFNYDEPEHPAFNLYAIHDRTELQEYCHLTSRYGIKPEVESFQYGAIWNAVELVKKGLLKTPVWTTFFLGWRGGCWTPPTPKALQYMHDHKPEDFNYNVSVMDPPMAWQILTLAIILGGHVRVGMEDNPYLSEGVYARSNAELVEKIVRISRELGREIATAEEARDIIKLK